MDGYEQQKRRADHQIWNAAASYGFQTDFRSFMDNGEASLYFNTIMGLIRRYYDYDKIIEIFDIFDNWTDGDVYSELLWLGLERLAWLKSKEERPAITFLRANYAKDFLNTWKETDRDMLGDLKNGWFKRTLHLSDTETRWEKKVLNLLEFSVNDNEERIKEQVELLFKTCFRRSLTGGLIPTDTLRRDGTHYKKTGYYKSWAVRHLGFGNDRDTLEHGFKKTGNSSFTIGRPKAQKVHDYVESCFGRSILSETESIALEKQLCVKTHKHCYFHVTKGEPSQIRNEDTRIEQKRFAAQEEKNREYYYKNLTANRLAVNKLAQRIRNTLLQKEEDAGCHMRAGMLKSEIAWRCLAVEDSQIFKRPQCALPDDLVVDILLDASASQLNRQEKIATQAHILAEAMTKCDIPVRVLSYCSVSGCTVLRIYRDYHENHNNEKIFAYTAAGWNRDGLAFRGMNWLLEHSGEGHRLVLILSDVNPNDDQKMQVEGKIRYTREYSGKAALEETKQEASKLRKGNRTVLCLYTGLDINLKNAQNIYGKEVIRIQNMDTFAETVGKLIQIKLQAM